MCHSGKGSKEDIHSFIRFICLCETEGLGKLPILMADATEYIGSAGFLGSALSLYYTVLGC